MNYIEFIENTGFALTSDVARQVQLASTSTLIEFRERYHDLRQAFEVETDSRAAHELSHADETQLGRAFDCPDAQPHEFRPVVHGRLMHFNEILGGNTGRAFETLDLDRRMRRVKSLLLYAHGVVLSDSLFYVNQFFTPQCEYFEDSRRQLGNYLTVIAALRPLIEAGIVIIYPQYEHSGAGFSWVNGTGSSFKDSGFEEWLRERCSNDDREDYLELTAISQSYNELLFFATRYDGSVVLPPQHRYDRILPKLADYAHRSARGDIARNSALGTALASIDIPDVDGISLDDVITIRRDSDTFETWRGLLSNAMKQIDNYEQASARAIVADVSDIVAEGKALIEKEVKKSSLWQETKSSIGKCVLASLAGLLARGTIDPATASATVVLSFVHQYVAGGTKRRANKSLRKHFATLTMNPH